METTLNVISSLASIYEKKFNMAMDEMKAHKLMYLAQRENLIMHGEPMFSESFYGWKYGPVLKSVRGIYKNGGIIPRICVDEECLLVIKQVVENYGDKSSWSLSRLTHNEISWLKSRDNIKEGESGDNEIDINDIRLDALRIKSRRVLKEIYK